MSCFWRTDQAVFVFCFDELESHVTKTENAHIQKNHFFWKISAIPKTSHLKKENDLFVFQGEILLNYCDLCKNRLRSFHNMCHPCLFQSRDPEDFPFDQKGFIASLREFGCYEVDKTHFNRELHVKKRNQLH